MEQFKSFFGEIVGRNDLDFLNAGNRNAIVQTHNTITNNVGGIVSGLKVTVPNTDPTSLVVEKGSFYTSGRFSEVNNAGGGERGDLYTQQTFRNLPATPPVGTTPQYLLVYAKIVTSNIDSNPLESDSLVTSKNLQTGENVPTREYPKATIVVTNPGFKSTLLATEGVHLALIQVDYIGINQQSSNGTIYAPDTSIANNYTIGGSVDVVTKKILDAGVPDNFLTTRMFIDNSIEGVKFKDDSVITQKIAAWDEETAYNDLTGSGVANQHLKDEVITSNKINFKLGLDGFGERNRVFNSSFEIVSGTSTLPTKWDVDKDPITGLFIQTFAGDNSSPKFGNNAMQFVGSLNAGPPVTAAKVEISQVVNFEGSLKDVPISAFYWAREIGVTDFTNAGTTGMQCKLEWLDTNTDPNLAAVLDSVTFGTISGISNSDYAQYSMDEPHAYTGSTTSKSIRVTLGGNFNGTYYVDGMWLGTSDLIPNFDVNPSEYIVTEGIDAALINIGQIQTDQLANGSVITNKIRNADGTFNTDSGNGITQAQIRENAVGTDQVQNASITQDKLATTGPGAVGVVPQDAIILWDLTTTCPDGFTEATEFAGRFALGRNPGAIAIDGSGQDSGTPAVDDNTGVGTTSYQPNHTHSIPKLNFNTNANGSPNHTDLTGNTTGGGGGHSHTVTIQNPMRTVLFCRKL